MGGVTLLRVIPGVIWTQLIYIYIYVYMRWVQVTHGVTLKSYTFFKPLDLSRSNGQEKNSH